MDYAGRKPVVTVGASTVTKVSISTAIFVSDNPPEGA